MSLYGYHRDTTPFLLARADHAGVFANAISTSCWTYPAVASILSGLYPHNHGGIYIEEPRNFDQGVMPRKVQDNVLFLPEILRFCGFQTYFASSIAYAEFAVEGRFQHAWTRDLVPAEVIVRRYAHWLRRHRDTPTFAYLHLSDPHEPLRVKEPHRSILGQIEDLPGLAYWGHYRTLVPKEQQEEFARFRANRTRLYDAAIKYVDTQLEHLFQILPLHLDMDKTLIIITADHGEELWDHTELEQRHFLDPRPWYGISHGHHLFQESIWVPLVFFGPAIATGFYEHLVSSVDIVPTLLALIGIPQHRLGIALDGRNAFDNTYPRSVLAEATAFGYEKKVIIQDNLKLYVSEGDGISWVFNLDQDPREMHPQDLPELAARLRRHLPATVLTGGNAEEMSPEVEERLRVLGYIE